MLPDFGDFPGVIRVEYVERFNSMFSCAKSTYDFVLFFFFVGVVDRRKSYEG